MKTRLKVSIYSREQFGQNWTILSKLDNSDKITPFGQNWTIRTKLDKSDKIRQLGQTWKIQRQELERLNTNLNKRTQAKKRDVEARCEARA